MPEDAGGEHEREADASATAEPALPGRRWRPL